MGKMKLFTVVLCSLLLGVQAFRYPSFLNNATEQAKEAFINIVTKDGLTPQEKDSRIAELVKELPQSVQSAYTHFKEQQLAIKNQFGTSVQNEIDLANNRRK